MLNLFTIVFLCDKTGSTPWF